MLKELNPKQLKFVELFLTGISATEAYLQAYGCARASADASAARLLTDTRVKALVDQHRQQATTKMGISAEWLAERVKLEAEREDEGSSHAARVSALKLAGMMLGAFEERHKHELSGPGGGPIEYDGKFFAALSSEDLDALDRILSGPRVEQAVGAVAGAAPV